MRRNKKFIFPVSVLFLFFSFVFVVFSILDKRGDIASTDFLDFSLSQYSDKNIIENAKIKNPKFEKLTFNPVAEKKPMDQYFASAIRIFKNTFIVDQKDSFEEYGSWLWTPLMQMTDNYMNDILDGLKQKGVNVVYLSIDSYLDIYSLENSYFKSQREKQFAQTLEKFIQKANERGMAVDAEAGWRNWAQEGHRYKPLAIASFVKNFNESHDKKLRGLQYDIEPYLLEEYKNDEQKILYNFIELVDETAIFLNGSDLLFSVVIPDFYDKKDRATQIFSYQNKKDGAFGHLLRVLDDYQKATVIIMSYRNSAQGKNGSIEASINEMKTASRARFKSKIIIAQETGEVLPPYITFHGTSEKYLASEIKKLREEFTSYRNFGGLAIHYANAFLSLK